MKIRRFALILMWMILSGVISVSAKSYSFHGISGIDGLSDLMVSSIYKDKSGYIWIGTASTIERFDGIRLRSYPMADKYDRIRWVNT